MPTMKKIILAFALFVSFAQAGQTLPVKAAPSAAPQQLSVEKWFVGTWTCEGTQHASPTGPEAKFTDKFSFNMVLGGSWLIYQSIR